MNKSAPAKDYWPSPSQIQKISWGTLVFSCLLGGYFIYIVLLSTDAATTQPAKDFVTYYAASILAQSDQATNAYIISEMETIQKQVWHSPKAFPWFYPPHYFLIIYPLAWTEYEIAFFLFMLSCLFFYIASAWHAIPKASVIIPSLAFPPVLINFMYGQNGLLTAALALLALHELPKNQLRAGIWIGILSIKPHLGLLFPLALVLGGYWRSLLSATITFSLIIIASIVFIGTSPWQEFITTIGQAREWMESGRLAINRMVSAFSVMRQAGLPLYYSYAGHLIVAAIFTIAFLQTWKSTENHSLRSAALASASLAISPYIFEYDLTWLGVIIIMITKHAMTHGWRPYEKSLIIFISLLPLADILSQIANIHAPIMKSWAVFANATLMVLIIKRCRKK